MPSQQRRKPDHREQELIMQQARKVVCGPFYDTVNLRLVTYSVDLSADRPPAWRSTGGGTFNTGGSPSLYAYDAQGVSVYDAGGDAAWMSWKQIYNAWRAQASWEDVRARVARAAEAFDAAADGDDVHEQLRQLHIACGALDEAIVVLDPRPARLPAAAALPEPEALDQAA